MFFFKRSKYFEFPAQKGNKENDFNQSQDADK